MMSVPCRTHVSSYSDFWSKEFSHLEIKLRVCATKIACVSWFMVNQTRPRGKIPAGIPYYAIEENVHK